MSLSVLSNLLFACLTQALSADSPFIYRILKGNLAPGGAVAKITGKEGLEFTGKARTFDTEDAFVEAVEKGEIKKGEKTVVVLRYLGPKGGPGESVSRDFSFSTLSLSFAWRRGLEIGGVLGRWMIQTCLSAPYLSMASFDCLPVLHITATLFVLIAFFPFHPPEHMSTSLPNHSSFFSFPWWTGTSAV